MRHLRFLPAFIVVVLFSDVVRADIVYDPSIPEWRVDRFVGNSRAGDVFYQGAAREVGGLQRPGGVVWTPEGVYVTANEANADRPYLYIVKNGLLRLVMDREGAMEGPIELCQSGSPIWNAHENTLYLTGPSCIRKVVTDPDGSRRVEVVAGTCGTEGSTDGAALTATLQENRGIAAAQDGAIYWMEQHALRKYADGMISTVPLTRADPPLWHISNLGRGHLSAGEDAKTLYINDYYNVYSGYGILKVDLTTNTVSKIIGVPSDDPNHGQENDGPALTAVGFPGGARGKYSAFYHAIFLGGADTSRFRWYRLDGDGWVRTVFGILRPGTEPEPFQLAELNSLGMSGEQFRFYGSNIHPGFRGSDASGGVYVGAVADLSGLWRVYNPSAGASPTTPVGTADVGGNSRIYMTLVDSAGQQKITPVAIAPSDVGIQSNPKAAHHNGVYLVVWADLRNETDFDVLGTRISSEGTVLDSPPLQIGTGSRTQAMPDVAADDQGFMVVWTGFQDDELLPHVYAARVSQDGDVGSASAIANGATPYIAWNAAVKRHFVLYGTTHRETPDARVAWVVMDSSKTLYPSEGRYAWYHNPSRDPNRYAVTAIGAEGWTFLTDTHPTNLWGRTYGAQRAINIVPDGSAGDTPEQPANFNNYPSEAGSANWLDYSRNTPDQWPWGSNAVAADGGYAVAVWNRYHVGGVNDQTLVNGDLYASRIDRWDPVEEVPVAVSTGSVTERNPALDGDGAGKMLVVYEKQIAGNPRIVARPLTISSQITVGDEEVIMGSSGVQRGFPDVVYGAKDSGRFMVVWQEGWYGENFSNTPLEEPTPAKDAAADFAADDAGAPSADQGNPSSSPKDGCSCRHPGSGKGSLAMLFLLAALVWRRRRSRA